MHVFYTPEIKKITFDLSEEESKHCVKVLRLVNGDFITMVDGRGGFYRGIIDDANAKKCKLRVIEKIEQYGRRNYSVHIAIAPTKNIERLEFFLEKCTEIGIDQITPLLCQHSERKVINNDRLEKIIIAAMKQSVKAYKPVLNPLTPFNNFVKNNIEGKKFIAHCATVPKPSLKSQLANNRDFTILIGPEGDFSQTEVELAIANNFQEVHLGRSRLRTETAGIVACNTINLVKDDSAVSF